MCNNKVTRAYTGVFEFREDADNGVGVIEGTPIVFNSVTNLGYFDEVIMPNALDETDLRDVRLCLNHDTSYVYARSRNNNENSTMQLKPNEMGMGMRANLAINESARHNDLYTALKRGDIDKMSFMFTIDGYEWENLESDHPLRKITKIGKVFEVSAVTFPAYDDTSISARDDAKALENAKAALESARVESRNREIELLKLKIKMMEN